MNEQNEIGGDLQDEYTEIQEAEWAEFWAGQDAWLKEQNEGLEDWLKDQQDPRD